MFRVIIKKDIGKYQIFGNQRQELGRWLSTKSVSSGFSNLIWANIDKFTYTQNNQVKHELPIGLTNNEIILLLDETYVILKYFVTKSKENTE